MREPRISSETVIGAALMKLGITYLAFATADHSPDWFEGDVRHNLEQRFGSLLQPHGRNASDKVVIVVDGLGYQYVVENMDELERVWRKSQIAYALTLRKDTFESLRGDVAIRAVPQPEPA